VFERQTTIVRNGRKARRHDKTKGVLDAEDTLLWMENVTLAPHIGAGRDMVEFAARNLLGSAGRCAYAMAETRCRESSSFVAAQGSGVMNTAEGTPVYEIYALKYAGPLKSKLAMLLWMEGWDEEIERNYYIWVIKGQGEMIVVDAGMRVALAEERKVHNFIDPVHVLERIGAHESNLRKVVLTRLHFDHAGGIDRFAEAFPNATFFVQEKEFDFWLRNSIAKRGPFARVSDETANLALARLNDRGRARRVAEDQEIMPGIHLLLAPGHTPGLQVVSVNTARGTAIVGSDCAPLSRNYREDNPSAYITDMAAWLESYDKVRSRASSIDLIFPGHDTQLLTGYPKVAQDVTRLA
jgi:glyoxylase-like metal-dependent hydrolase (beta-lactamase superfamily II)